MAEIPQIPDGGETAERAETAENANPLGESLDPDTIVQVERAANAAAYLSLKQEVHRAITRRAYKLDYKTVYSLIGDAPFILAGGAVCGDKVSDFDLYEVEGHEFDLEAIELKAEDLKIEGLDVKVLAKTKNALTVELPNRQVVQFCRYHRPSLKELVKSFDFTHIQAGITFPGYGHGPGSGDAYCTEGFIAAALTRSTRYVASEYPFSSIVRAGKYLARGRLTRVGAAKAVAKALADFLRRGFKDYVDFKDQLDAIDLSLEDCAEASELYAAADSRRLIGDAEGA